MTLDRDTLLLIQSTLDRFKGALRGLVDADRRGGVRVLPRYELVCSERVQDCVFAFEVPASAGKWDGERLSLVILREQVVLIRNGESWLLPGARPDQFENLPGGGSVVFYEARLAKGGDLPWKNFSTGQIVRPPVH